MTQNQLQKRIEQKAKKRAEQTRDDFLNTIRSSPFGERIWIKVEGGVFLSLRDILIQGDHEKFCNKSEVMEKVTNIYIEEETDALMNKLSNLEHFFNDHQ